MTTAPNNTPEETQEMIPLTVKSYSPASWLSFFAGACMTCAVLLCLLAYLPTGTYVVSFIPWYLWLAGGFVCMYYGRTERPMTYQEEIAFLTKLVDELQPDTKKQWIILAQKYPNIIHTQGYLKWLAENYHQLQG